jgi:tyrosinase
VSSQHQPFVRRNVWTLPSGDPTVEEYASAVAIMKARPHTDPTSWSYQAAIHGTHTTPTKPLWNNCKHGTWFFLSWHRMFLYYFEQIVRAAVVQAGGSHDWALPYWDYGAGGQQAQLPSAFRSPTVGGHPNPLFVAQRASGINGGGALSPAVASPAFALGRPKFTGVAQFGGGITPAQQFSAKTGRLEQTPHNDVHNAVGGGGWMSDPDQAAQDPIFWLHHSNIDRLWHVWNRSNPSGHKDPTDPRWRTHPFSFFDVHGHQVQKTGADVVDIRVQLGYVYEEVPGPVGHAQDEEEDLAMASGGDVEDEEQAELVGASDAPVTLVGSPATATVQIDQKAVSALRSQTGAAEPSHIYLSVEDIDGERNPGTVYGVYVNLPEGASPQTAEAHHAGNVSFFGLERARDPRGDEQAHTLRVVMEITDLAQQLAAQGEWDGHSVSVTFRPLGLIPPDRPDLAHALPEELSSSDPAVTIGRVSVAYA